MPNIVATEPTTTYDAIARRFVDPPPGKLFLLYGDPIVFQFSISLASYALLGGTSIAVVDGCNSFDAHRIARFAREHTIDPDILLNRVHVSRGFTCYQMEAAITDRLPTLLQRINASTALIFGLLDTFYDEQAPLREVQQSLRRIVLKLQEMKSSGISVLLASQAWNVMPRERNRLLAALKTEMDRVYRVEMNEESKPKLFLEKQTKSLLFSFGGLPYGTHSTNIHQYH